MKRVLVIFMMVSGCCSAQAQNLSYYLPDSVEYDLSVPRPKEIIFHEVGEWHVTHDRLLNYMNAIAAAMPSRVKMEVMGFSYEQRPQVLLIITSPKNHQRLEEIRQQHLQLTDPSRSGSLDIENMPVVVWIGHSIHGNEPSGSNASLLTAYYLAAARGKAIDELLDNTVILFDPSFNPDGLQRFSTWVNQHKSKNLVSDPSSREFNETWPGGRFNHYWFDLNRDWLPAVHVESQNRLKWFHQWKPNVLTDHHEQGSNATFFFQPGIPSRVNPLTPGINQELTAKLGTYHAKYLDRIGSLYFTKENYDDFYYGKGSTYPDVQGSVGVLFEQASSRGHLQQTNNGLLSFPFTIRNQFVTALSTLEGAAALRKELLEYQRNFFRDAVKEAASLPVKAFVFGKNKDASLVNEFLDMLHRHQVRALPLLQQVSINNVNFVPGFSYVVSLNQPQSRLIRNIFERTFHFKDSLFYDITSWTMPLAFGIDAEGLNAEQLGHLKYNDNEQQILTPGNVNFSQSSYAYLVEWSQFHSPALLYELLNNQVIAKVATNKFRMNINGQEKSFETGSILIPVGIQSFDAVRLHNLLKQAITRNKVEIIPIESGTVTAGSDIGSSRFVSVTKPSIALITGPGVNATDAGEVWHLLDQRMNIPVVHLEPGLFNRIDLDKYNTLIMVGGTYNDINKDKLKTWVQNGGLLILTEEAVTWAAQAGITDIKFKKLKSATDSTMKLTYRQRELIEGAQQMNGAIFGAEADLDHPLAYGYHAKTVSLFKSNKVFMEKSRNPYGTPFHYGGKPLQSGWVSRENADAIANSAAVVVSVTGTGRVINIADNPNFRAFWLGGSKLFLNAIFFGRIIDAASARTD